MLNRIFASKNNPCFVQDSLWDTLHFNLSGDQLSISLPPHDWEFPEESGPSTINVFDSKLYDYADKPDRNGFDAHFRGVTKTPILQRHWYSYGSIASGHHLGTISCSGAIIDTSKMETALNCLIPDHLERLVLHLLYYSKGPGFSENEFSAPINWKILSVEEDTQWVYTESWPRAAKWDSEPDPHMASRFFVNVYTPIFKDKALSINFYVTGSLPAEPSNTLMFARINKILSTIKLQFAPQADKQKQEVQDLANTAPFSMQRSPESWKYYESFLENEEGTQLIGPCSPPPKLP